MFLDLDAVRPAVFDGIAQPPEQADAGIAGIGEDQFAHRADADQLVVDHVGGHAHQREILDALADRLMGAGVRDEMGETFESGGVTGFQILRDRFGQRHELRHDGFLSQMSKKTVSSGPCR